MRIDVSEQKQCGCVTCIHHRTPWMLSTQGEECGCFNCIQHRSSPIFNTRLTEPTNVIGSSVTSIPVSSGSGPVLASTSTSSPAHTSSPISSGTATPTATPLVPPVTTSVSSEPEQKPKSNDGPVDASTTSTSSTSAPVQSSSPSIFSSFAFSNSAPFAAPKFSPFGPVKPPVTDVFSSGASAPPAFGFGPPATAPPAFGRCCASSTPSPFGHPQAPVQTSATNTSTPFSVLPAQDSGKAASPPLFARPDVGISPAITTPSLSPFGRPDVGISPAITPPNPTRSFCFSQPFGPTQDFEKPGACAPRLPRFGVGYSRYHSNPFGPNRQTTTPASVHTQQGSRYPRYAPTPDLDDPRFDEFDGKFISISASNSHGNKSHEELRWEDYKNVDKGGRPNAFFSSSTVSPSLFASPSIPTHPQRTTGGTSQENITGFTFNRTIPTAVERPHEPAGVSSPASGCTACGATSSSSNSGYLGFNAATSPPSPATSLSGFFFPTSGFHPMMFGTPNLAAQGTTPAVQAYPMTFGTQNLAGQGTTQAVQAYPVNGFILLPSSAMYQQ